MSFYPVYEVLMANTLGWSAFPPPVDHILPELWQKTMTHPSWVSLHTWLIASSSYASPFAMTRQ